MWPWPWASWADACAGGVGLSYRSDLMHKGRRAPVTNRIAIFLGMILIAAFVADTMMFGKEHLIYLGKKLFDLIEWIAFWR